MKYWIVDTRKPYGALRQAMAFAQAGLLRIYWVVYHRGHRVCLRPMEDGFMPTPHRCGRCGQMAERPDDLRYAMAAIPASRSRELASSRRRTV